MPSALLPPSILAALRARGVLPEAPPRITPLTGGVSSDIFLVVAGGQSLVVKRALPRLRVQAEWLADIGRNRVEQAWLRYAAGVVPAAAPKVLCADPDAGWFAMEYLQDGWTSWKAALMQGELSPTIARAAGQTLGQLHAASWGDPKLQAEFATLGNFTDLRIHPYFLTAAQRVPAAGPLLRELAAGLSRAQIALVHGDFSPKNLLVKGDRVVVVDAEVAWFGDPAFDVAFLANHLFLKALYHARGPAAEKTMGLVEVALSAYREQLADRLDKEFETRLVRLVLGLMFARVHGKSPVEYLQAEQQQIITDFVLRSLSAPAPTMRLLADAWMNQLRQPA
jgi:aminoglycoside phosphotransferase (APT) family kinase protein